LTSADGAVNLVFPAEAVTQTVGIAYWGRLAASPSLDGEQSLLRGFETEARASSGQRITQFNQSYTMTIDYTDAQLASLGVFESTLNVSYWNGDTWVRVLPCAGCNLDMDNNYVTITLDHFSEFALTGQAASHSLFLPFLQR